MSVPRAWDQPAFLRKPSGRRFFWGGAPLARSSQTAASLLSPHRLTASPHFSMSGSHEGVGTWVSNRSEGTNRGLCLGRWDTPIG